MSRTNAAINYSAENPKNAISGACCNIITQGVMAGFFAKYAFENPDVEKRGNCWANEDTNFGTPRLDGSERENVSK